MAEKLPIQILYAIVATMANREDTFKVTTRDLKGFDTFQRSHNVTSRLLLTIKTPAMSAIPLTVTKQQKFDNRRKLLALTGPQSCNLTTAVRQKLLQRSRQSTRRSRVLSMWRGSITSNERDILKYRYRYSYLAMFFPRTPGN